MSVECWANHGWASFISLLKALSKPLKRAFIKPLLWVAVALRLGQSIFRKTIVGKQTLGMEGSAARPGVRARARSILIVSEVSM